eukprot:1137015-Pelagomonas_calceolata.AAC.5
MGKLCVWRLLAVFLSSAILGDAVNYLVGSKLGSLALSKNIIKQEYISKTEAFYEKYGGKTVGEVYCKGASVVCVCVVVCGCARAHPLALILVAMSETMGSSVPPLAC